MKQRNRPPHYPPELSPVDTPSPPIRLDQMPEKYRLLVLRGSEILRSDGLMPWRADDLALQAVSDLMRRAKIAGETVGSG